MLLLVAVATTQLWLAARSDLSPWSGGGFGMFSTLDHATRRHLHVYQVRPGLRREIAPPPALREEVRRSLTLPSEARLRRLALEIAKVPTADHGEPLAVQIQVWHTRFDPATLTPASAILRELVVPLEPGS